MAAIRVSYRLTPEDVAEARRRLIPRGALVACGVSIICTSVDSFVTRVALLLGLISAAWVMSRIFRSRARELTLTGLERLCGTPEMDATISESGVMFASPSGGSALGWSAAAGYRETRNLFLIYAPSSEPAILPKRAFEPDDLKRLRGILKQTFGRGYGISKKDQQALKTILAIAVVALLAVGAAVWFS